MNPIKEICITRLKELEQLVSVATNDANNAPSGSLQIVSKENYTQFYHRYENQMSINPEISDIYSTEFPIVNYKKRKYINKSNRGLIIQLAQKEYAKKILTLASEDIDILRNILDLHTYDDYINVLNEIHPTKKGFVSPYLLNDKTYIDKWEYDLRQLKEKYSDHIPDFPVNIEPSITEKDEIVRSKSEKILADKLFIMGVPYVYEVPMYLKGYGYAVPDFRVLNIRTRKTYYWEHLGMMDDENYIKDNYRKIDIYQKNGIFQGRNIIFTFETSTKPISGKMIELLVNEFLK